MDEILFVVDKFEDEFDEKKFEKIWNVKGVLIEVVVCLNEDEEVGNSDNDNNIVVDKEIIEENEMSIFVDF